MNLARHVVLACVFITFGTAQQSHQFDGRWWLSLEPNERVEFVAGYIDCFANDLGEKGAFPESWYGYAPRITLYYAQNPQGNGRPVTSVLFDVRSKKAMTHRKGGEVWTDRHGFFDGEYWREMGEAERIAFVEGYLACYREHLSSRPKHFSRAAPTYSDEISRWFGAGTPDSKDANLKREKTAIADVLYEFADSQ